MQPHGGIREDAIAHGGCCGSRLCARQDTLSSQFTRYYREAASRNGLGRYYHRDHLGSVRAVTDDTGAALATYSYDPYGRQATLSGLTDSSDFGYAGHYRHAASGLALAPYRAYDADIGRWLSRDPIGEAGGINIYAYVNGNPVNLVDPLGLDARVCCKGIRALGLLNVRYCYIQLRDKNGNMSTYGLFGDTRGPLSKYGEIFQNDPFDNGGSCGSWNEKEGINEQCEQSINNYPNPSEYDFAFGPNSNTFAGTIAQQNNLLGGGTGISPGYNDPPAKPYKQ